MKRVSVVIPNHNYAQFVGAAVEGALAQTYPVFEVIVIDNGSTDNSLKVLEKFGSKIRIIAQENRGQSGARNRGIEESRGDFVAFCDADDVWQPRKIEEQMKLFTSPEIGLVYCGYSLANAKLEIIKNVIPENRGKLLSLFADGAAAVIPAGESSVVIRKECFAEAGTFDPDFSISAGFDLYRRIAQRFEIDLVPQALVLYRQHATNTSRRLDAYANDYLRAIDKMFSDPGAAELLPLRRRCLGRAHVSLSGAYIQSREIRKSLRHLALGLRYAPQEIGYVLKTPVRVIRRRLDG